MFQSIIGLIIIFHSLWSTAHFIEFFLSLDRIFSKPLFFLNELQGTHAHVALSIELPISCLLSMIKYQYSYTRNYYISLTVYSSKMCRYIAWNVHEPQQGQYNFNNDSDIESFIKLVNSLELLLIVRPGKYCHVVEYTSRSDLQNVEFLFSLK